MDKPKPEQTTHIQTNTPSATVVQAKTNNSRLGFLERTGIYSLEMTVAMITMMIIASVLSVGAFALGKYLSGSVGATMGNFALWSAASTAVWLPIAFIFYRRASAYMERNPAIVDNQVQRAFVVIYQVVMLLTAISFAFTAVYSLLHAFVQEQDMGKTLASTSLPAFISALVFGGAFVAFFRKPVIARRTFANLMLVVSLLIIIPVIVFSMIVLRDINSDERRSRDLVNIQADVEGYFRSNNENLPDSLDAVKSSDSGLNIDGNVSDYTYNKKTPISYELCTNFKNDNQKSVGRYDTRYYKHKKGETCYTNEVYKYKTPSPMPYRLDSDSSSDL